MSAERIYVLPTQDPCGRVGRVPRTALDAAVQGLGLLMDSRLKADIARYSQEAELIVLPAPNTAGVHPTSFTHSARLMGEALDAARALLATQRLGKHLRVVR